MQRNTEKPVNLHCKTLFWVNRVPCTVPACSASFDGAGTRVASLLRSSDENRSFTASCLSASLIASSSRCSCSASKGSISISKSVTGLEGPCTHDAESSASTGAVPTLCEGVESNAEGAVLRRNGSGRQSNGETGRGSVSDGCGCVTVWAKDEAAPEGPVAGLSERVWLEGWLDCAWNFSRNDLDGSWTSHNLRSSSTVGPMQLSSTNITIQIAHENTWCRVPGR